MNHLIAKIRDRKKQYRKVTSGDKYFKEIDISDSVIYNPATLLEDRQWYKIEHFQEQEFCLDILKSEWDSTEYDVLRMIDTAKMDYICAYQSGNEFYFQRIYKSSVLSKQSFLRLGDNIKFEKDKNIIVLNNEPDALYLRSEDCLYFKKLETVAPIFKGIDSLYKEATVQEVTTFFKEPFMNVAVEFTPCKVGKANRKRLGLVVQALSKMNDRQKKEVFEYTNDYYPQLAYNGDKFTINNNEDLKNLLFGIEERYYTTPVTHEQRAANSVIVIANNRK